MGKIICVASTKGGTGKTTTTVMVGHGLALAGNSVLLLDLDPQGQVCSLLGIRPQSGAFNLLMGMEGDQAVDTGRAGLFIIPGDKRTASAATVAAVERWEIGRLRTALKPFASRYEYILIDTAPSVTDLVGQAVYASDMLVIPASVDFLAAEGAAKIMSTANDIQKVYGWKGQVFGVLPQFFDRTNESSTILTDMQKHWGESVLPVIHRSTKIREASAVGKTVFEVFPDSRAANEYLVIAERIARA